MSTPNQEKAPRPVFKSKDRVLMKNAVEQFKVYAGKAPCAGQRSALAYFTLPLARDNSDFTK